MKRTLLIITAIVMTLATILSSCSRGISPSQAANGKVKCGRYVN